MRILGDSESVSREDFMWYLYFHAMSFLAGHITLQRFNIAVNAGRDMSFSPIWQEAFSNWDHLYKELVRGNANEITAIGDTLITFNVAFGRIRKGRHG